MVEYLGNKKFNSMIKELKELAKTGGVMVLPSGNISMKQWNRLVKTVRKERKKGMF